MICKVKALVIGGSVLNEVVPVLTPNSKAEDIRQYIAALSESAYSQVGLEEIFSNLFALEIDTYNFTYGANLLARNITQDFADILNNYLEAYEHQQPGYLCHYAFISYYLLAYYYREYEEMVKLGKLVARYDDVFQQYALTHQIRGRLLRRQKGQGRNALDCDLQAIQILKDKRIENIGVWVTYASTVSLALENNASYVEDDDITHSIESVIQAIHINPLYGKYNYLLAKLYMFEVLKHEESYTYEYCIDKIMEAKELLRKAIELEDTHTVAYASQVIEFKSYMRQADWILSEIRMLKAARKQAIDAERGVQEKISEFQKRVEKLFGDTNHEIDEKFKNSGRDVDELLKSTKSEINSQFKENREKVNDQLNQMQNKYMEIFAIFVSVVSIIVVVIDMLSNDFSSIQLIVTIVTMNACVLAVYSVFLILLRKVQKKYIITLIVSLLAVLAMFLMAA